MNQKTAQNEHKTISISQYENARFYYIIGSAVAKNQHPIIKDACLLINYDEYLQSSMQIFCYF